MPQTVAAIITPLGEGGIGVIQVSGPSAVEIVNGVFRSKNGKNIALSDNHRLFYGTIHDAGGILIDEVIVNVWHSAADRVNDNHVVEINCHGGIYLVRKILELLFASGAVSADCTDTEHRFVGAATGIASPLELVRMEALCELPTARTKLAAKVLLDQYHGALSSSVAGIVDRIEALGATILNRKRCLETNRVETNIGKEIPCILTEITRLLDTFRLGMALTRPARIVIAGKPNVGKSTLTNSILGDERVVVHHLPGTTRDPISELISINGIPFDLVDTAGIRQADDEVEEKGVAMANDLILTAQKIILVFDGSAPLESDDLNLINSICANLENSSLACRNNGGNGEAACHIERQRVIPVINKSDLPAILDRDILRQRLIPLDKNANGTVITEISAISGKGRDELEDRIAAWLGDYINYQPGAPVVFNDRQFGLVSAAHKQLEMLFDLTSGKGWPERCCEIVANARDSLCKIG